jgi:chemotaxis protein MotB
MAGKRSDKNGKGPTIVIRKEEVVEGGHHGGAWKVAYADFVTAMMAFFLLMWLLNATTEAQRKGLADYFSPNNVLSRGSSGSGKPFGGSSPMDKGALASNRGAVQVKPGDAPVTEVEDEDQPITAHSPVADAAPSEGAEQAGTIHAVLTPAPGEAQDGARLPTPAEIRAERARTEKAQFEAAAEQIREAVRADPALAALSGQLAIDLTPEGLRIQILDEERSPMFATGSAVPNDRARLLLQKVAPVLVRLPEAISLSGHTDATPFRGGERSNWELSTERANATRRLLIEAGLPEARIRNVTGNADRDPLLPADPLAAANRRIAIVVLRTTKTPEK